MPLNEYIYTQCSIKQVQIDICLSIYIWFQYLILMSEFWKYT